MERGMHAILLLFVVGFYFPGSAMVSGWPYPQQGLWKPQHLDFVLKTYNIDKSITINGQDSRGDTLLHLAARTGDPEKIIPLFMLGSKEIRNCAGKSPRDIIAYKESIGQSLCTLDDYFRYRGACKCFLRNGFWSPHFAVVYLLYTPYEKRKLFSDKFFRY